MKTEFSPPSLTGWEILLQAILRANTEMDQGRQSKKLLKYNLVVRKDEIIPTEHQNRIYLSLLKLAVHLASSCNDAELDETIVEFLACQMPQEDLVELLADYPEWEIVYCDEGHCETGFHVMTTSKEQLQHSMLRISSGEQLVTAIFGGLESIRQTQPRDPFAGGDSE